VRYRVCASPGGLRIERECGRAHAPVGSVVAKLEATTSPARLVLLSAPPDLGAAYGEHAVEAGRELELEFQHDRLEPEVANEDRFGDGLAELALASDADLLFGDDAPALQLEIGIGELTHRTVVFVGAREQNR
jgi:hypothetical protein